MGGRAAFLMVEKHEDAFGMVEDGMVDSGVAWQVAGCLLLMVE